MEQFLSNFASLFDSEEFTIFLTAWGALAIALTIALVIRKVSDHMAGIEEAKHRQRVEASLGDEKAEAEQAEAERALEALQSNAADKVGPRTARDFIPYGYSDRAA
ncbi:MAG: hypothetical protein QGI63_03085 [Rhodospirillales bacterium]|mgnify:CR=1 FL=1|jgi:hypothetical protein|nr:hypothetical protein [Rhodospirillales bacterium]MDP6773233.1 hypothetical protein [Rhodospirillales bacterium]